MRQPFEVSRSAVKIAGLALSLILLAAPGARPATAVVIDSGDGAGNSSAPADDPGWSNVGALAKTTGVYLGDRWVLTAGHSGGRELRLGDQLFEAVQGKIRHGIATAAGTEADLQLFQLRESPELPRLRLASSAPRAETQVVMIGSGLDRSPSRAGWSRTWASVPLGQASYAGYRAGPGRAMRWGTNRIAETGLLARTGKRVSRAFATVFDGGLPTPHEAQATAGDSGGAVFAKNGDGEWELVGIMITASMYGNQPANLTVYGNASYAAEIHAYREQIERILDSSPDHDGDGILDIDDNCTRVRNADQADADGDGTGDRCEEPEGVERSSPGPVEQRSRE